MEGRQSKRKRELGCPHTLLTQGECRAAGIAWHLGLRFCQSGFILLLQSHCPPDNTCPLLQPPSTGVSCQCCCITHTYFVTMVNPPLTLLCYSAVIWICSVWNQHFLPQPNPWPEEVLQSTSVHSHARNLYSSPIFVVKYCWILAPGLPGIRAP